MTDRELFVLNCVRAGLHNAHAIGGYGPYSVMEVDFAARELARQGMIKRVKVPAQGQRRSYYRYDLP